MDDSPDNKNDPPEVEQDKAQAPDVAAAARDLTEGDDLVPKKIREFLDRYLDSETEAKEAAQALGALADQVTDEVAGVFEGADVARLMGHGQLPLARKIVGEWEAGRRDRSKFRMLADAWLQLETEAGSHDEAVFWLGISRHLAIFSPSIAKSLMGAFRLSLQGEGEDLQALEERIEAGLVLERLSEEDLFFWESCLGWKGDSPLSWESDGARKRLASLGKLLRVESRRPRALQRIVPACWWDEVTDRSEANPVINYAAPKQGWGFAFGLAAGVVIAPLAFLVAVEFAPEFGLWWEDRSDGLNLASPPVRMIAVDDVAPIQVLPEVEWEARQDPGLVFDETERELDPEAHVLARSIGQQVASAATVMMMAAPPEPLKRLAATAPDSRKTLQGAKTSLQPDVRESARPKRHTSASSSPEKEVAAPMPQPGSPVDKMTSPPS